MAEVVELPKKPVGIGFEERQAGQEKRAIKQEKRNSKRTGPGEEIEETEESPD